MKPTLGQSEGRALPIDVDRLVATRMLLTANSGAGKSWALRRLLEQTHGAIQQLVIDPEGEFYTLRERFDYVLASPRGECPAEPRSAALLARRLLELGTSAILDLYELAPRDRVRFVRLFLEGLIDAPRELWHPVLVVVDEAHAYAPEKGHGEAESADAVARLMAQGRKRGFAGILATQRLSKLAKDVAAEANNVLIGRAALDVDMKRAAAALGLPKSDALRTLPAGHFYAFGPALCAQVKLVEVGAVATSHPRAGARAAPPPPPREKVQKVLAQLADLPREAAEEARTVGELRGELKTLKRELEQMRRKEAGVVDQASLERARSEGRQAVAAEVAREARTLVARVVASAEAGRGRAARAIDQALEQLKRAADALREPIEVPELGVAARASSGDQPAPTRTATGAGAYARPERPAARASRPASSPVAGDSTLGKGERATLIALAQQADGATRQYLTVVTGYKRSSRDAYLQRLRAADLVEELGGGRVGATPAGIDALGTDYEPLPTGAALREWWLERLPEGERRVLAELVEVYPEPLERGAIDEATGYKRSSRDAYLQRLSARELVEDLGRGTVRAAAPLFD